MKNFKTTSYEEKAWNELVFKMKTSNEIKEGGFEERIASIIKEEKSKSSDLEKKVSITHNTSSK